MKRWVRILISVSLVGVLAAGYFGYTHRNQSIERAESFYEQTADMAVETPQEVPSTKEEERAVFPEIARLEVDFDSLRAINEDILAWIWLPDSEINYPMLHPDNNETYLKYSYDGEKNIAGSIFMDYRCSRDLSDYNSIIYGHRILGSTAMFGELHRFLEPGYWEAHRYLYLYTDYAAYKYEVFSAYTTEAGSRAYLCDFLTNDDYQAYLAEVAGNSQADTGVVPTGELPMITLSTCTKDNNHLRFVVHAKMVASVSMTAPKS